MGMYDIIGGEQVKCFYVPVIAKDHSDLGIKVDHLNMWRSTGNLKEYKSSHKVPWRTMWYDYTPNFIIFDPRPYMKDGSNIHIIHNGRYRATTHYKNLRKFFLPKDTKVIDIYGDELNLRKLSDFDKIRDAYRRYQLWETVYIRNYWKKFCGEDCTAAAVHLQEIIEAKKYRLGLDWKKDKVFEENWTVGAFLYGLSLICKTDDDVERYLNYFEEFIGAVGEGKELENAIARYALWCSYHHIPITLMDLEEFFFIDSSLERLNKIVKPRLY